ncbi:PH domain-containing protein [Microbacterium sp. GXF7504]
MTNPDPTTPDQASPPPTTEWPAVLDVDTFDGLVQPRSPRRIDLGHGWHQVSRRYRDVQLLGHGLLLVLVAAGVTVGTLVLGQSWPLIPGGLAVLLLAIMLALVPRQARAIGYRLRADDLVVRRGILWQRVVAVPYGRMQLVDITHGPLDRRFRIAQLKLVTAAATSAVSIPGLDQDAADALRDHLVEVAEHRRTGL